MQQRTDEGGLGCERALRSDEVQTVSLWLRALTVEYLCGEVGQLCDLSEQRHELVSGDGVEQLLWRLLVAAGVDGHRLDGASGENHRDATRVLRC